MQTKERTTKIKEIAYSAIFFALFICFTVALAFLRTETIKLGEYEIMATRVDVAVFSCINASHVWLVISEIIGYVAIFLAFLVFVYAVVQFFKLKSIKKLNPTLVCVLITYAVTVLFYVVFELVSLNYRPVLVDGQIEKSYPSSHALLTLVVSYTIKVIAEEKIRSKKARVGLNVFIVLIVIVCAIGRLFSAMHWLSDVIGSVLLGLAICFFSKALRLKK